MIMTIIKIVEGYIARGWAPVPVPFKEKGPTIPEWHKLKITKDDIGKFFNGKEQNVGVILGAASDGLVDVDLDCPEAVALAPKLLPATGAIFGRHSKPRSHYLYIVSEPEQKAAIRLQDSEDSTIIELRLGGKKGAQTVFPGSTHPSGEAIEWTSNGEAPKISCSALKTAVTRVAVGSLLFRNWPQKGRHEACLRLGGFLARVGWSLDQISDFVEVILTETGSNVENGRTAAIDAAEMYEREGTGYGLPALAEFFGEKVATRIGKFLEYHDTSNEDDIEQLNKRFCILPVSSKMRVLEFKEVLDRRMATFYAVADFRIMLDNKKIKTHGKNKDGDDVEKHVGIGSWWLNHKARRQFDGLVFRPGEPGVVDGHMNLWRGWGIEPREGKWSLLKNHIKDGLANGYEESFEYILKWMTWTFQNPGRPAEVVLVFRGGKGTGKGMFAREIKKAFGQHGVHISSAGQLAGRFNAHLMDCAFLFADEAFWPGDKASEGTLKRMITEDVLFIERKGVDGFEVDNSLHIMMVSNVDWIVPASLDERRFAVFDVSEEKKQSSAYFSPIYKEIKEGAVAAMMHEMLNADLGGWHPRDSIPRNAALGDQQSQSLSPMDQWWLSLLHAGELPEAEEKFPRLSPSQALFEQARASSPQLRFTSDHLLARFLKRRGCDREVDYRVAGRRAWQFPPLLEARSRWEKTMHVDWEVKGLGDWRFVFGSEEKR